MSESLEHRTTPVTRRTRKARALGDIPEPARTERGAAHSSLLVVQLADARGREGVPAVREVPVKAFCPSCHDEHQVPWPKIGQLRPRCPTCRTLLVDPPRPRTAKPKASKGISPASPEQREKAALAVFCIGCGQTRSAFRTLDPAHVAKRSSGGCDSPDCVVILCRTSSGGGCHRAFDEGRLDLLPTITGQWPGFRKECQHALEHLNPTELVQRLAGTKIRWEDEVA